MWKEEESVSSAEPSFSRNLWEGVTEGGIFISSTELTQQYYKTVLKRKEVLDKIESLAAILGEKYHRLRQERKSYEGMEDPLQEEAIHLSEENDLLVAQYYQLDRECKELEQRLSTLREG